MNGLLVIRLITYLKNSDVINIRDFLNNDCPVEEGDDWEVWELLNAYGLSGRFDTITRDGRVLWLVDHTL